MLIEVPPRGPAPVMTLSRVSPVTKLKMGAFVPLLSAAVTSPALLRLTGRKRSDKLFVPTGHIAPDGRWQEPRKDQEGEVDDLQVRLSNCPDWQRRAKEGAMNWNVGMWPNWKEGIGLGEVEWNGRHART